MAEIYTSLISSQGGHAAAGKLLGVGRCPHCSVASPNLNRLWSDTFKAIGTQGWATYRCNSCNAVVCGEFIWEQGGLLKAISIWPDAKAAHEDVPQPARTFLQQAFETLHAPDAAAVMAGSAVDAMLKHHGYTEGSLYKRIDQALEDNLLTKGMADWAHEVRLGSNRPRHADADKPHVSSDEAKQSVEFAEALGNFLFVLTAKIDRGIAAAKAAEA
ncbi:DUF4145 domain-containing protein [Sinorhizobium fredii]|uniref:DUF4145 domain-containing protein n=1 Tax=Rhizobium fredii TaxID=380 RepID=A0A2L0H4M7_RHIFR|nr:DUF4145 domain-containing protein [Sinorhizobium fredii]AUX76394.1 hypothetical protein NXT3_CH01826 [Sinorhizobium fredii]